VFITNQPPQNKWGEPGFEALYFTQLTRRPRHRLFEPGNNDAFSALGFEVAFAGTKLVCSIGPCARSVVFRIRPHSPGPWRGNGLP